MKKFLNFFSAMMVTAGMAVTILGCSGDDPKKEQPAPEPPTPVDPVPPPAPTPSSYTELYRPQIHFTPAKNWINDPNGMVYADGVYHLFYQYNPQGNSWGNMSWGHATSTDMIHWTEQAVALTRDELGDIFSGSAVIDANNTAGFGAGAMIAFYTSASDAGQQQSMAYSTDGGKNFTRYTANPVIKNNDDRQRDPKVFWHADSQQWIMSLAKGWSKGIEFFGSTDMKTWNKLSTFVMDLPGRPDLQWECPDLLQFGDKWVLIVSVNPGGPILGSGTMYFVGQFDGKEFKADALDYPLWLDYGMDNYAGVTWSNTGDRKVLMGWMNNWSYAGDVPCSPWRSAMTLPRELKLTEYAGKPLLCCPVVSEIDKIASQWQTVNTEALPLDAQKSTYQLRLNVSLGQNTTITLGNSNDEKYVIDVNASSRTIAVHRNASTGKTNFNGSFSIPSMQALLNTDGSTVVLDIFVDQSSVEITTQDGTMSMTNLVFPQSIYDRVSFAGTNPTAQVRSLSRIWN